MRASCHLGIHLIIIEIYHIISRFSKLVLFLITTSIFFLLHIARIWQHQQITQIRTTGTIHSCLRKSIEYCIFILIPSCIVPRTITTLWSYLNKPKRKTSIRNAMPKLSCTDKRINVLSITLDV